MDYGKPVTKLTDEELIEVHDYLENICKLGNYNKQGSYTAIDCLTTCIKEIERRGLVLYPAPTASPSDTDRIVEQLEKINKTLGELVQAINK